MKLLLNSSTHRSVPDYVTPFDDAEFQTASPSNADTKDIGSTSRFLKEEVCSHFDMNKALAEDPSLLKTLTK